MTVHDLQPPHIALQDCVEWLKTFEAESVDLVVTDPAYESLEKHRAVGTTTRLKVSTASSNEWFPIFRNERFPEWFEQLYRVMKRGTHLYVMCDQETMFVLKPMAETAGFQFHKALVWDKGKIGMGYHYRARHEMILFLEKRYSKAKGRQLNDLSIPDVLRFDRVNPKGAYPTQKPYELLRVLVEQSSQPGDLVIDPFAGSGSTGYSAIRTGRRFRGADVVESAVKRANEGLGHLERAMRVTPLASEG